LDLSPTTTQINAVVMASGDEAWAVGNTGTFLHYVGGGSGGGSGGYAGIGTFLSHVVDADASSATWQRLYWQEVLPAGTDLTIGVRVGKTSVPDGSWTSFSAEFTDPAGGNINLTGRYLQYRATLTTSDSNETPQLQEITFTYKP